MRTGPLHERTQAQHLSRIVVVAAHGLLEGSEHGGIAAIRAQSRQDAEDRVAPLAKRDEIVETFEDDVLFAEMRAVAGILQPVHAMVFSGSAMRRLATSSRVLNGLGT